jgi:hypothetical protein
MSNSNDKSAKAKNANLKSMGPQGKVLQPSPPNAYKADDPAVRRAYFLTTKGVDVNTEITRRFLRKLDAVSGSVTRLKDDDVAELKKRHLQSVATSVPKITLKEHPTSTNSVAHNKEKSHPQKESKEWWEYLMDTGSDLIKHFAPLLLGMGDYDQDVLEKSDSPDFNSILAASAPGTHGKDMFEKMVSSRASEVPMMHESGLVTRVAHREYLGDVLSTTAAFLAGEFPLNPGMKETFPWLANVASNYTTYQFLGLVFEFVSEGSEYTNSAGLGYDALATQYDANAAPYVDKRTMLNSQFADAAKPSKSYLHWVECAPEKTVDPRRLVRSAANPPNSSLNDYDIGKTTLAVGGNVASNAVIGELWVSYDVLLYIPKSVNFVNTNIDKYSAISTNTAVDASPLGFDWTSSANAVNTFNVTNQVNGTQILFPKGSRGRFFVELAMTRANTATANSGQYNPTYVGCSSVISTGMTQAPNYIAGQANTTQSMVVDVFTDGASITLANSLNFFGAGTGTTRIIVTQIPAGLSECPPLDRGGFNRDVNYKNLMDTIQLSLRSNRASLLKTKNFSVFMDTLTSKCMISCVHSQAICDIAVSEVLPLIGKPEETVDIELARRFDRTS